MDRISQVKNILGEILDRAMEDAVIDAEDDRKPEEVVVHLTYDEAKILKKILD